MRHTPILNIHQKLQRLNETRRLHKEVTIQDTITHNQTCLNFMLRKGTESDLDTNTYTKNPHYEYHLYYLAITQCTYF